MQRTSLILVGIAVAFFITAAWLFVMVDGKDQLRLTAIAAMFGCIPLLVAAALEAQAKQGVV